MTTKIQYKILRKDLFPDQQSLEDCLADYKEKGLDVEKEIEKMVSLGYIKKDY